MLLTKLRFLWLCWKGYRGSSRRVDGSIRYFISDDAITADTRRDFRHVLTQARVGGAISEQAYERLRRAFEEIHHPR